MAKTIITAALTGAVTPKSLNPNIPITPKEIAEDAIRCWKAGAAVVHLHMRDENGYGTMDKNRFKETVDRIRSESDVIINLTSSGAKEYPTHEMRIEHIVELKPDMCSFDVGTFNWLPGPIFPNSPDFLRMLGKACIENNVKPEIEIFDYGMIDAAVYFQQKEQVLPEGSLHFQFVLGVLGQAKATPYNVARMASLLPEGSTWSALGIGKGHMPVMFTSLACGGNLRVGLEDNVYYSKGVLADNKMLVDRAARAIKEYGNEVATVEDACKILCIRNHA